MLEHGDWLALHGSWLTHQTAMAACRLTACHRAGPGDADWNPAAPRMSDFMDQVRFAAEFAGRLTEDGPRVSQKGRS